MTSRILKINRFTFALGAAIAFSAISVAKADDAEWMQVTWPAIAAVVQPVHQIAGHAMEALFARIEGEEGPPTARLEPCKVLMRESVGSPGSGPHSGGGNRQ